MTVRGLVQRPWQVRAFLDGRRTQVRVPMKPQGPMQPECWSNCRVAWLEDGHGGPGLYAWDEGYEDEGSYLLRCPLGAPGTVLAIRETWRADARYHSKEWRAIEYKADGAIGKRSVPEAARSKAVALPFLGSWRSPATMPLWAARLRYRVLDIRAHSVREISDADAIAEGATSRPACYGYRKAEPGWSMDWSRVGQHSRWASGGPGPLTESDVALGTARFAFGSEWCATYGEESWERGWCFAATVEPAP